MIKGIGVGLRQAHYAAFLSDTPPDVSWLEILSDNYMWTSGVLLEKILKIRERYPMVMHGVGLNIGSTDALDFTYLRDLKCLADRVEPAWISDHLCWTGVNGYFSHDLLPLPYTHEALTHISARIHTVQDYLKRPFIIENISTYFLPDNNDFFEADFLAELAKKTGCNILLDINNIAVNAHNHQFSTDDYIKALKNTSISQIHLAGYEEKNGIRIDTHGHKVYPDVWKLYQEVLSQHGAIPTCIEWDSQVPVWETLYDEVKKARQYYEAV